MNKVKAARAYLHDRQPEIGLLRLATKGIDTTLSPTESDFATIVESLNSRKMVILFKWFWKHADVVRFADYLSTVNAEGLVWYLSELSKIVSARRSLHWIERVNLFHVYGLSRLFGKEIGSKMIGSFPFFSRTTQKIGSLADLSACNVALMLKEAGADESLHIINSVGERSLLAEYGMYQIYYYQGVSELIDMLNIYMTSSKQSIVPQTIAGIFEAEPHSLILSKSIRERIYEEIIMPLPTDVGHKLETLDKNRNARTFKNKI